MVSDLVKFFFLRRLTSERSDNRATGHMGYVSVVTSSSTEYVDILTSNWRDYQERSISILGVEFQEQEFGDFILITVL